MDLENLDRLVLEAKLIISFEEDEPACRLVDAKEVGGSLMVSSLVVDEDIYPLLSKRVPLPIGARRCSRYTARLVCEGGDCAAAIVSGKTVPLSMIRAFEAAEVDGEFAVSYLVVGGDTSDLMYLPGISGLLSIDSERCLMSITSKTISNTQAIHVIQPGLADLLDSIIPCDGQSEWPKIIVPAVVNGEIGIDYSVNSGGLIINAMSVTYATLRRLIRVSEINTQRRWICDDLLASHTEFTTP